MGRTNKPQVIFEVDKDVEMVRIVIDNESYLEKSFREFNMTDMAKLLADVGIKIRIKKYSYGG
jgi:hypothetical protein